MTESKTKKLIVAGTVGAVLLMIILVSVMVYQLISISVYQKRIKNYDAKIAEYERLIEQGEDTKETYQLRWWIEREARRLGLVYAGDED